MKGISILMLCLFTLSCLGFAGIEAKFDKRSNKVTVIDGDRHYSIDNDFEVDWGGIKPGQYLDENTWVKISKSSHWGERWGLYEVSFLGHSGRYATLDGKVLTMVAYSLTCRKKRGEVEYLVIEVNVDKKSVLLDKIDFFDKLHKLKEGESMEVKTGGYDFLRAPQHEMKGMSSKNIANGDKNR